MTVSVLVRVFVLVALVLAMMPAAVSPAVAAPAEVGYVGVSGSAVCGSGASANGRSLTANSSYSRVRYGQYYFLLPANRSFSVYSGRSWVGTITTDSGYTYGPTLTLPC